MDVLDVPWPCPTSMRVCVVPKFYLWGMGRVSGVERYLDGGKHGGNFFVVKKQILSNSSVHLKKRSHSR